jgi:hypothetical protein
MDGLMQHIPVLHPAGSLRLCKSAFLPIGHGVSRKPYPKRQGLSYNVPMSILDVGLRRCAANPYMVSSPFARHWF